MPAPSSRAPSRARRCFCTASASPSGSARSYRSWPRESEPEPDRAALASLLTPDPNSPLAVPGRNRRLAHGVVQLVHRVDALLDARAMVSCCCAKLASRRCTVRARRGQPLAAGSDRFEARGAAAARPSQHAIAGRGRDRARDPCARRALALHAAAARARRRGAHVTVHIHGEKAMADVEVEPEHAARSPGEHSGARRRIAARSPAKELALVLRPIRRPGSSRCAATPCGACRRTHDWRIDDLRIPVAGRWRLRVEILISDFDKVTVEDQVELPRAP